MKGGFSCYTQLMLKTDSSAFPLVTVSLEGDVSAAEIHSLVQFVGQVGARSLAERTPFVLAGACSSPFNTEQRRLFAELYLQLPEAVRLAGLQSYVHLDGTFVRGALRALQWVIPTFLAGMEWARSFDEAVGQAKALLADPARQKIVSAKNEKERLRRVLDVGPSLTAGRPLAIEASAAVAGASASEVTMARQSLANPW